MAASVLCCKTQDNTIGKDRPLKTATYLRVSTNDQDLEAQRQLLDRFGGDCRDPQLNLVVEYFDFGKSGDSFNSRPGLQQLFANAQAGMFEAVLVRQLSRLSRCNSLKAAAQIISPLCDAGIKIIDTVHGDLKLDTPEGRIILSVMAEMDHAENVSRALNIANGMLRAAEKGSWSVCAPDGYRCIGEVLYKQLVLDDSLKAETVLRMFELSAAGESGEGIARILNADGIPSPKGGHRGSRHPAQAGLLRRTPLELSNGRQILFHAKR